MKKIFLSLAVLVSVASSIKAQTEKGKFMVGGRASYERMKDDGVDSKWRKGFRIMPNVGYFLADKVVVGMGLGYEYDNLGFKSGYGQKETIIVAPFGRMYFPMGDQFAFYGEAQVPLSFSTTKSTDDNAKAIKKEYGATSIGVSLSPGFSYFPTKTVGIEFAFNGIKYVKKENNDADGKVVKGSGSTTFDVGPNFFSPKIGVQFFF